jgi:uncharacterized sporulation protein YeaH/YhbH (DUF444 family)
MSDYHIIDRRENPKGKNLPNRQKFLKRVRKHVKEQVRDSMGKKKITDDSGESVSVPADGISEPSFDYDRSTGEWERILPGNREFVRGDRIKKPRNGSGSGSGSEGSNGNGGEDDFRFTITREEYLDLVFEDLELPDMIKRSEKAAVTWQRRRAGFKTDGNPSQLDLVRSMKNSIGRRLAVKRPLEREIAQLEEQLEKDPANQLLIDQLDALRKRNRGIPWVDPMDLRYRRWDQVPVPNSQAVMFCLMDVSGSMGQSEKEIAKRFYLLLYLFLQRKYERVQIVFVRHTEHAKEVDENDFFNSQESGGTVVSSGLEMVDDIIRKRYPIDAWNIYVVQASDGDNYGNDNRVCTELLRDLLPKVQYYVYAEVKSADANNHLFSMGSFSSGLWDVMGQLIPQFDQLTSVRIPSVDQVVPVFREVFAKERANG